MVALLVDEYESSMGATLGTGEGGSRKPGGSSGVKRGCFFEWSPRACKLMAFRHFAWGTPRANKMISSSIRCVMAAVVLGFTGVAEGQSCIADITGDGVVDGTDLAAVLAQWGPCGSTESCLGDVILDAEVDGKDLATVLSAWGVCPVVVPMWATRIEEYPDPAIVHDSVLRASIVATGYAWRVRDTATQIEMVLIPPGTFQMGCSPSNQSGCTSVESPVHTVTLTNAFYMGRYEVTQAQWLASMGSNPSQWQSASVEVPASQVSYRPVERVSWNTIQGFMSATGMRLPTEAEWEYAYRAGTTTAFHSMPGYPNGTNDHTLLGTIAWFTGSSGIQTRPVGQLAGNGFGLHDMSGNVWEWVNDWYSGGYYASSPSANPPGPSSGSDRVLRGGSWPNHSNFCRSSFRLGIIPSYGDDGSFGFRVARNP
jgi:formylglycine-generating enzyme required for sulfatase activity